MFFDRHDAGRHLALELIKYKSADAVVYSLSSGGTLVGYEIAKTLFLPLDILIIQKIYHPVSKNYAICTVSEKGERVCDEYGLCGIDELWIVNETEVERTKAENLRENYRFGKELISAKDRVAIIVDDGISTGLTVRSAILTIRKQNPAKIIVAAPIVPDEIAKSIEDYVVKVVAIHQDKDYLGSTAAYYKYYPKILAKEVSLCLSRADLNLRLRSSLSVLQARA